MNGIVNVLKPPGMTSQNVVSFMRRTVGIKKIGHSGTLDPYAAGVLPIFIGKATRVVEYAMAGEKEYIGEICFGIETDTLDAQGKIVARDGKEVSQEQFERVLQQTHGVIYQRPPMYSALKMDGQKLVNLARKGKQVEIPKRPVEIFECAGRAKPFFVSCAVQQGYLCANAVSGLGKSTGNGGAFELFIAYADRRL